MCAHARVCICVYVLDYVPMLLAKKRKNCSFLTEGD